MKSRFFRADKYNDRKAAAYWTKFQYPFWWPNLLTALDSLSLMGYTRDDDGVQQGLEWFSTHQQESGLWETGYGKAKKAATVQLWVALAVCRVFERFYG